MEHGLSKTEKIIITTLVVLVVVFVGLFSMVNKSTRVTSFFENAPKINYNMGRPESTFSEYTLEGREIDLTYKALKAEKAQAKKKNAVEQAKKKEADKKKTEAAKKQAAAQVKARAEQAKRNALKQKQNANKLAQLKKPSANQQNNARNSLNNNVVSSAFVQETAPAPVTPEAKPKKTFTEWRAQIFANPTSEMLGQFLAAFRKNEVTATEYQALAQELIAQEDQKLVGLGLQALRSVTTLASLSQLVHVQDSLSEPYQQYVEEALLVYFYPQNLALLSAALGTQDKLLKSKILTLLDFNLTRLSQGDQTVFVDPRNLRATSNVNFTMASFRSLLPALFNIQRAQDQEFSGLAQKISELINTASNVAQVQALEEF